MKAPTRIIIPLALVCLALAPHVRATCQEGCGGGGTNTFLGEDALLNDCGTFNTAVGQLALQNIDSTATGDTAVGAQALASNTTGLLNTAVGGFALLQHHWRREHCGRFDCARLQYNWRRQHSGRW